jgi:exopolysaccharide biosynthesis polyprenyl glycosylphosphotransferase
MAFLSEHEAHDGLQELMFESSPLLLSPAWAGWQQGGKRLLDIVVASLLLVLFAPLFILIAIAIRIDSAGPIIYRQTRLGKDGKPFTFLKFRGMVADAEMQRAKLEALNEVSGPIFKIRNDPRVTRVGRMIRRLSLDELPQLWNVMRGDMSLVGPRPPLHSEVVRYEPWQHGRLSATPGMTGLWQVKGRSTLDFVTMVRLDLEYIEHWSLWLDLSILVRTIPAVLSAAGAY